MSRLFVPSAIGKQIETERDSGVTGGTVSTDGIPATTFFLSTSENSIPAVFFRSNCYGRREPSGQI